MDYIIINYSDNTISCNFTLCSSLKFAFFYFEGSTKADDPYSVAVDDYEPPRPGGSTEVARAVICIRGRQSRPSTSAAGVAGFATEKFSIIRNTCKLINTERAEKNYVRKNVAERHRVKRGREGERGTRLAESKFTWREVVLKIC